MPDPRARKLAQVLVHYSLAIQPGDKLGIITTPLAEELTLLAYEEALRAGAFITLANDPTDIGEIFYRYAKDHQLDQYHALWDLFFTQYDAILQIDAPTNTRVLSNVPAEKRSRYLKAGTSVSQAFHTRLSNGDLRWVRTVFPNQAMAQEADMSLADYEDFVYTAGKLNEADPIAAWEAEARRQHELINWLSGRDQVRIQGEEIDLTLSIKGRSFLTAYGKLNFPDGEIYTSPVEDSAAGWVRFKYPAIYTGQEVSGIQLWFQNGRVVREQAERGQELLVSLLDMDANARTLGELGIGTNFDIGHFSKYILFDEKLGGTIHLAVGSGFPNAGGKNKSGLHWDMICDMSKAEIRVDNELFYKDGKFTI